MPHQRTSKRASGVARLVLLVGAVDEIAPLDYVAFEKKAGELIGRSASARKHAKGRGLRPGELVSLRKREKKRDD